MKTLTLNRIYSLILGLCVLFLLLIHFTTCTEHEPALVEQAEPCLPQDTVSDWDILYLSLVKVESGGDQNAIGKTNDAGVLQITPIYVKDANRILKQDKFTLECRFSPELSKEMFEVIQSHYNPDKSIKKAIKLHNPRAGDWYAQRVEKEMDRIKSDISQLRKEMDSVNLDLLDFFD